jgi:hypothetical protein
MMDRAERAERASATLLRVTVSHTMARTIPVRITWKGRTGQYEFPDLTRKGAYDSVVGVSEYRRSLQVAIALLEEELYAVVDGKPEPR